MVKPKVDVAAGVILSDQGNKVLLAFRQANQHQGNLWEFPGGKLEPDEAAATALARELKEEIDVTVGEMYELMVIEHDYGDKAVRLHVFLVRSFSGQPTGLEGQRLQWVPLAELASYDFPEANTSIVEALLERGVR